MMIFLRVLLGAAVVGLIVGLFRRRAGNEGTGRIIIVSLAVGVLSSVGLFFWPSLARGPAVRENLKAMEAYTRTSTYTLGAHLAEKFPGSRAIVVLPYPSPYGPGGFGEERINQLLAGLREGLVGKITIVETFKPQMPEEVMRGFRADGTHIGSELMVSMDEWFTASYFDDVLMSRGGRWDMAISLAGLPADVSRMAVLQQSPRPKLAAWYWRKYRAAFRLREDIAVGDVAAVVAPHPQRRRYKDAPKDLQEAFERRFLLLTPENVEKLTAPYVREE